MSTMRSPYDVKGFSLPAVDRGTFSSGNLGLIGDFQALTELGGTEGSSQVRRLTTDNDVV